MEIKITMIHKMKDYDKEIQTDSQNETTKWKLTNGNQKSITKSPKLKGIGKTNIQFGRKCTTIKNSNP